MRQRRIVAAIVRPLHSILESALDTLSLDALDEFRTVLDV
jgi:hypothetical protein